MREKAKRQRLHPYTIEKEFNANTAALNDVIILDGIDLLDDPPRFRIRTHDLHCLSQTLSSRTLEIE